MPRKVRELKRDLRKAGFEQRGSRGKGSHSMWHHRRHGDIRVSLSGNDGSDAQRHLEEQVAAAIKAAKQRDEDDQ